MKSVLYKFRIGFGIIGLIIFLPQAEAQPSSPLSPAHQASQKYALDPAYDAAQLKPAPDILPDKAPWIYGDAQLEAWKIDQLVNEGFAANRHVHYERNYGRVAPSNTFRHVWPENAGTSLTFRSNRGQNIQWI